MPGDSIKGVAGAQSAVSIKQQGKIEGAERNISKQENKNTPDTTASKTPDGSNKIKTEGSGGTGNSIQGARGGSEDNIQRQAENLNSANNVASTAQPERGQNVNAVV